MKDDSFDQFMDKVLEAIRDKRKELGLTQDELGERMGKPQSAVARFEAGGADPRISMLFQVCQALDTNPAEILGRAYDSVDGDADAQDRSRRLKKLKERVEVLDDKVKAKVLEIFEGVFSLVHT